MTSFKETHGVRPLGQHRPPASTIALSNLPTRYPASRNHSQSLSSSTFNPTHRVTRRKSMTTSGAANLAAITAAVRDIGEAPLEGLSPSDCRGQPHTSSNDVRKGQSASVARPSSANYKHNNGALRVDDADHDLSLIDRPVNGEDHAEISYAGSELGNNGSKARARRASEGAFLSKADSKRGSGDLRCEQCGKGYKHSSCLVKHLWEHTPEWSYTSKLLISKHQQVQLLEAASVLVTMNKDMPQPLEIIKVADSDNSSNSPAVSASSEMLEDDLSSIETTPPPTSDQAGFSSRSDVQDSKRYSSNSSVFSRSYQSAPSGSVAASSVPTAASFGSLHYAEYQRRLSAVGIGFTGEANEDEADLAAAVELCHFGTPRMVPVQMADIPPVPPLPARYASNNVTLPAVRAAYSSSQQNFGPPPPLNQRLSDERDVRMRETYLQRANDEDEYYDQRAGSHARSDEDDDGVFGRMEE